MKRVLQIFHLLLYANIVIGQSCLPNGISFYTQQQADNFLVNYPNCTEIEGKLYIGQSVSSLAGLTNIVAIHGELEIKSDSLENLQGLNNLNTVGGDLTIFDCQSLTNVSALNNLSTIGGKLDINSNESLLSIAGFNSLIIVGGRLIIENNLILNNLEGFSTLTTLDSTLILKNNIALTNFEAFANLQNIGVDLVVEDNTSLENIEALSNLSLIGESLILRDNEALLDISSLSNINIINSNLLIIGSNLENLNGLQNLATITESLTIESNHSLLNIDDLNNVTTIGGDVLIRRNYLLINMNGLNNLTTFEGSLAIMSNDALEDLSGLENTTSIMGSLVISDNESLLSISLLSNLLTINNSLSITSNPLMTDLVGLTNISSLGSDLSLKYNDALTSLIGLENLISISGSLEIQANPLLENLDGLGSLRSISGLLVKGNNALTSIDGLVNLETSGSVLLEENPALIHIDGLNTLTEIHGIIRIFFCHGLESIGGFNAIQETAVIVTYNNSLSNITGFANLTEIDFNLEISHNPSLTTIEGFNNLTTIYRDLLIEENNTLESISGLNSLVSIGFDIRITNNDLLENITGLSNLLNVGYELVINYNNQLTSIIGLNNLESIGLLLQVVGNSNLSDCSIEAFCRHISDGNFGGVAGNGVGCQNNEEVLAECLEFGFSGNVFYDFNQNQQWDDFEAGIPGQEIAISPAENLLFSGQNGLYFFYLEEEATYTFSLLPDTDWELTTDSASYTITYQAYDPDNQDNKFGLYPNFNSHDFSIHTTASQLRCNTLATLEGEVCNAGTFMESGDNEITLFYDSLLYYEYAMPLPTLLDTLNHTITWVYDTLYPWQCFNFEVAFTVPGENYIGEILEFDTQVFRDSLGMSVLGQQEIHLATVVCSYDPNDKLVNPSGEQEENYTAKDETFDYTVRFQNTGNIEAIDVTIRDTLDTDLNWNTFRVIQASHPVQTTLYPNGAVTFYFKDIYLPDSLSNPLGSQGFIRYTIDPNPGLPDFTLIENTAYIYFDFNSPIITNTTSNTMVDAIPVRVDNLLNNANFLLFPNPTDGKLKVVLDNALIAQNYRLQVRNAMGEIVIEQSALHDNQLDLSTYPPGLYTIILTTRDFGSFFAAKRVLLTR